MNRIIATPDHVVTIEHVTDVAIRRRRAKVGDPEDTPPVVKVVEVGLVSGRVVEFFYKDVERAFLHQFSLR